MDIKENYVDLKDYLKGHEYTITPMRIIAFLALCYVIFCPQEVVNIASKILS